VVREEDIVQGEEIQAVAEEVAEWSVLHLLDFKDRKNEGRG
jgi:hypothetical protein